MIEPTFEQRTIGIFEDVSALFAAQRDIDHLTARRLDALEATSRALLLGMDAITEAMATRADLDDLRLEVRDATATTFDAPERPHAA